MLGSPTTDPVWFGFLKTWELRVKFRVGFGPDPALASHNFQCRINVMHFAKFRITIFGAVMMLKKCYEVVTKAQWAKI